MGAAEYFVKNRTISWMVLIFLTVGGVMSFLDLGRLEDPPFKVKDALIVTAYPGATAEEVEQELTHQLEQVIRQIPEVDTITSSSKSGLSQIKVAMDETTALDDVDQLWDRLRRKVSDVQPQLPQGAHPSVVYDDYGDVYGVTLMVTGDNYSYSELKRYVEEIQRDLELVEGVGRVALFGQQQEQIFVEISLKKLAALNLDMHRVVGFLNQQNAVLDSGRATIDGQVLHIRLGGLDAQSDPVIHGRDSGNLIRLSDVATIHRGFQEVPSHLIRMNSQHAIALAISFADGVNVVEVGDRLSLRLQQLEQKKPAGISLQALYDQPEEVKSAINGFLISLLMAVVIVIAALLLTMGWRSGLIVGVVLLLTMLGTFMIMDLRDIQLHRLSLGALIIALGMLVDNAIVVVEGVLVGMARGMTHRQACFAIVKQTKWPLLASTFIAILAFTPFGLSQTDTGQIMKDMFWVLTYSLALSWITAITLTPFLVDLLLTKQQQQQVADGQPHEGALLALYHQVLDWSLANKARIVVMMLALLLIATVGFGFIKKAFFPPNSTPMFYVDLWMPQGTDIRATVARVNEIEKFVLSQEQVEFVSASIGRGAPRFNFTYLSEQSYEEFAQLQIRLDSQDNVLPFMQLLESEIAANHPMVTQQLKRMEFGPSTKAKIEARFIGPDIQVLRRLGEEAAAVMRADPLARSVMTNWKSQGKELVPVVNEAEARRLGISNEEIASTIKLAFNGVAVGLYRDGVRKLPIMVRLPEAERVDFESIHTLRLWSPVLQTYVPIQQVVNRVDLRWSETVIRRKDRQRTLTVMATNDLFSGVTAEGLLQRVRPGVEAIELPPGYKFEWGGEFENSQKSLKGAFGTLPVALLLMFLLTLVLFNSFRQSLVIWLTVPLLIIGVAFGLLLTNMPLTFPALLGMLSLIGMVIKNGIVLVDQINVELDKGQAVFDAVRDSAISRVRPVSMAAATTVLGMLPLVTDAFFSSQAIVFIFGLSFATVLTLVVLPVIYLLVYRVKS
ncbi:MAG: multidrug efflux RND transporter permease subunit VmeV [Candidatus Pelagadaptatus aseana]|uniref:efflux RND transporter permease subunit n=1 Tax=Candidatus Pelagadaptatus aseana TaxID=3120508 RepID=UPI0039B324D4